MSGLRSAMATGIPGSSVSGVMKPWNPLTMCQGAVILLVILMDIFAVCDYSGNPVGMLSHPWWWMVIMGSVSVFQVLVVGVAIRVAKTMRDSRHPEVHWDVVQGQFLYISVYTLLSTLLIALFIGKYHDKMGEFNARSSKPSTVATYPEIAYLEQALRDWCVVMTIMMASIPEVLKGAFMVHDRMVHPWYLTPAKNA